MSITVSFATSSKKINSTSQPSMTDTYDCNFKNGCSMLNPILLLEISSSTFPEYTEFKIGNTYYFITDIRSVRNNLFEIYGEVDVLATYKTYIGNSTQYISRSSNTHNPYIKDVKYPALADTDLVTKYFNGLATDQVGTYIIGVVGIGESSSCVKYYALLPSRMNYLLLSLFHEGHLDPSMFFPLEIQKELFNPFQYIVSCYWYPVPYSHFDILANHEAIMFGWWEAKYSIEGETHVLVGARIPEEKRIYSWEETFNPPKHPQAPTRGIYLNDAPYTRYTLNCYSFGSIALNPSPFVDGDAAAIEIDVDLFIGTAQLYVTCSTGRLFTAQSQFGVPVQISQNTANFVNAAIGVVQAGTSIATHSALGFAKGISSAIQGAFPQVQTHGNNGSKVAFMQTANITAEFRNIADEYNTDIGRPLCAPRQISTIPGYIECENVEIEIPATSEERNKVASFMENGFFYE